MLNGTAIIICKEKLLALQNKAAIWLGQFNVVHVALASVVIGLLLSFIYGWIVRKVSLKCRRHKVFELSSEDIKHISSIAKAKKVLKKGSTVGMSNESISKRIAMLSANNSGIANAHSKILLESEIANYVKEIVAAPKSAISFLQASNEMALLKAIFHYRELAHKSRPNVYKCY